MFSKKSLLVLVIVLVGTLAIGCTSNGNTPDVVATVNGTEISLAVFEETVERVRSNYERQGLTIESDEDEAYLKEVALDSLIEQEAVFQKAKNEGYEVTDEILNQEFQGVKGQFDTDEEFQAALKASNYTEQSFRDVLAKDLLIEQFVQANIQEPTVSEEEMIEIYNEYKEQVEQSDEGGELLSFEDVREEIEYSIKQQKEHVQLSEMIDEIVANSEIEKFI